MVSTAITTTNGNRAVSTVNEVPEGWENVPQEAFSTPSWQITQPAAKREGAGKHGGEFYHSISKTYRESLDVVILRLEPNNTLWAGADAKSPECTSNDWTNGSRYGKCKECVFNRFANPELAAQFDEGLNPKSCNTGGLQFLLLTLDDFEPAIFRVHGKSIAPTKVFDSMLRRTKQPIYGCPITISAKEESNAKGRFFTPRYEIHAPLEGEERAAVREQWLALKGVVIKEAESDEAASNESDGLPDENAF